MCHQTLLDSCMIIWISDLASSFLLEQNNKFLVLISATQVLIQIFYVHARCHFNIIRPTIGLVCGLFSTLLHWMYCIVARSFKEWSGTTRSSWSAVNNIVAGYCKFCTAVSHGLFTLCNGEYLQQWRMFITTNWSCRVTFTSCNSDRGSCCINSSSCISEG